MATQKHTPGPWREGGLAGSNDGLRVEAPGDGGIFLVAIVTGYIDRDRRKANAQLIAAAPELLAALRKMIEFYWEGYSDLPKTLKAHVAKYPNSATATALQAWRAATGEDFL